MKRLYCIIFFLILCIAGPAGAIPIPFQVGTNGTLDETVTSGPGLIGGYTALGTDVFY